jgi:hypothetical protein
MKKHEPVRPVAWKTAREPERPAIGLEAEFVTVVDGEPVDPKDAFGDPRAFLGQDAMHRVGSSYHLPNGGAVYFDTGVVELVTPVMELAPGAPSRAVRSLWEGIVLVRQRLDEWSSATGRDARLVGFSAHYNISLPELGNGERIHHMAHVLIHMLPFPVMLFAANPRSTGVGVRPRPDRIEVTVDFTPDAALMTATAAVIAGAVREVCDWSDFELSELERRGYPVIDGFRPVPHTSRKGWLARFSCFEPDPFRTSPDRRAWRTTTGDRVSVRTAARRVVARLLPRIREFAAPDTVMLIRRVLIRRHPSLLDLEDRPATYEDVGREGVWQEPDPSRPLARSLYEQVMLDAMDGRPIRTGGRRWRPVGTTGWTRVRYRSDDGRVRTFSVDELVRIRESH